MRTIGLLGGMSWESTSAYYSGINELTNQRLGGLHSARIVLYSVDFEEVERLQRQENWEAAGRLLTEAGRRIAGAGADFLLICTNTMHKVAGVVENGARIPLLHIADATADAIHDKALHNVGLLGTRFTMEEDFFRARLGQRHGVRVVMPDQTDRDLVHRVIYDELCLGKITEEARREFQRIIHDLANRGAEGVILGCTEIGLLIQTRHVAIPVFDTTRIHVARAVDWALGGP